MDIVELSKQENHNVLMYMYIKNQKQNRKNPISEIYNASNIIIKLY